MNHTGNFKISSSNSPKVLGFVNIKAAVSSSRASSGPARQPAHVHLGNCNFAICHSHRGRVGAMCRKGYQDLVPFFSPMAMIGQNDHARQFSMSTGGRLQSHAIHAGNFFNTVFRLVQQPNAPGSILCVDAEKQTGNAAASSFTLGLYFSKIQRVKPNQHRISPTGPGSVS